MKSGPLSGAADRLVLVLAVASVLLWAGPAAAQTALEQRLSESAAAKSPELVALREFYAGRGFRPLWLDGSRLSARGAALKAALARAGEDGLDPALYAGAGPQASAEEREIGLSAALLRYAAHVRLGRAPARIKLYNVAPAAQKFAGAELLRRAEAAPDLGKFVAGLAPANPAYARQRAALARYRKLAASGGWPVVAKGAKLLPGATDPRVPVLRGRLAATGDMAAAAGPPATFDAAMQAGLKRFQQRHGLVADGKLGAWTLRALNVPAARRADQIGINLERLRWMPDQVVKRAVVVNAAAFELNLIENGKSTHRTRVIVGRCGQDTPQFATMMTGVQFNPYWRVPWRIAQYELLPAIKKDPSYIRRKGYRVLDQWGGTVLDPSKIDWKNLKGMPYKLRQQPGAGNALGRLRFLMPNPLNVFLHDTPSKRLFKRRRRAFSHGCVRVEKPLDLAYKLLRDDPQWTRAAVQRAATVRTQRRVLFQRPLPVYVGYFTAWAAPDGKVHFREDLYLRDAKLKAAIGRAGKPARRTR